MQSLLRRLVAICVAVTLSLFAVTASFADDKSDLLQISKIATSFISALPMDKKYVLKSLSPDATGIPEDFLRRLTSDVEAGLLFASDNAMNLSNHQAIEEVWQEATELNDAKFKDLYAKSNADAMIMISPRLTADGVEISLTAYELSGEDVGKVLASSGTSLLKMDVKTTLGVDVNSIEAKLDTVLSAIQNDKLKPKTEKEMIDENTKLLFRTGTLLPKFIEDYGQPLKKSDIGQGDTLFEFEVNACRVELGASGDEIFYVKVSNIGFKSDDGSVCDVWKNLFLGGSNSSETLSKSTLDMFYTAPVHADRPQDFVYTNSLTLEEKFISREITLITGGEPSGDLMLTNYSAENPNWNCDDDEICHSSDDVIEQVSGSGDFWGTRGDFGFLQGGMRLWNLSKNPLEIITNERIDSVSRIDYYSYTRRVPKIRDFHFGTLKPITSDAQGEAWRSSNGYNFKSAFDSFKEADRIILKKAVFDAINNKEKIDPNWNSTLSSGIVTIITYVSENAPPSDFKVKYGLNSGLVTPENFLAFIKALNCDAGGLLNGTPACKNEAKASNTQSQAGPIDVSVVPYLQTSFMQVSAEGRIKIKTGMKRLGFYTGASNPDWNANLVLGFGKLITYLTSGENGKAFVDKYGFSERQISREQFLKFLNDLNCNPDGLFKGGKLCN